MQHPLLSVPQRWLHLKLTHFAREDAGVGAKTMPDRADQDRRDGKGWFSAAHSDRLL
jgi:hypothetical protein